MLKRSDFLRNRKIWILLGIQLFLIALGTAGLFERTGIVIDRELTGQLLGEGVPLPAGVYTARLYCEVTEDTLTTFEVASDVAAFKALLSNPVPIRPDLSVQECQFYLRTDAQQFRIVINNPESLSVRWAEITGGTEKHRIFLFWVLTASLGLDGILILAMYHRKHPLPPDRKLVLLGIPALTLLSSLPVLVDYNVQVNAISLPLMQIEALVRSIVQNWLSPEARALWLTEHGYTASPVYGDMFLFLPASLRILGFHPTAAWQLYTVAVNLATTLFAYLCFRKCFENRYTGMLGSALYTLLPFRLSFLYTDAAVGAYTAMVFLPLSIWSFYRICRDSTAQKGYLWNGLLLAAGLTGILQSDITVFAMALVCMVILCLFYRKTAFRPHTFRVWLFAAILIAVLNTCFLVSRFNLFHSDPFFRQTVRSALPTGFLAMAGLWLTIAACAVFRRWALGKKAFIIAAAVLVLASTYQLNNILLTQDCILRVYSAQSLYGFGSPDS